MVKQMDCAMLLLVVQTKGVVLGAMAILSTTATPYNPNSICME